MIAIDRMSSPMCKLQHKQFYQRKTLRQKTSRDPNEHQHCFTVLFPMLKFIFDLAMDVSFDCATLLNRSTKT